ncbi:interferon regulatory factor 8-like isoform X2 [Littorina saxatilis]|uniref:IRF tryptophan pentad repeat domain-containing protein n=1 Tax=Littorina saxatilis TaxID=31220 RepID=A0AAN9BZB3_9CAEN
MFYSRDHFMDPGSPESSGGNAGSRVRQRLKPWLEAQINSGRFPGVEWVSRGEGIFRITWKHGGRADWSEQDGLIFKEWAIHTGRFREGTDNPDWPSWKTRLRCALNKLPDIQELKELSCYDEPNPYRVYKFVDRRGSGSSSPTQQHLPPPLYQPPHRPSVIQTTDVVAQKPNIPHIISESLDAEGASHRPEGDAQVTSLGSDLEQVSINDLLPIADNNISLTNISVDSNINSCPEPMDTDSLKGASYHQLSQHVKPEPVERPDPLYYQASTNDDALTLTLRYRRQAVAQRMVTKPEGCRVYYGSLPAFNEWDPQVFGDYHADQVHVPYNAGQLEARQEQLTVTLLNALERGINIYVEKGSIYVLRRCKASVFTSPANKEVKQTIKVEREHRPVKIFDFSQDFLPAFMRYQQGEGPRPSPQVIIAIGQNFRDDVEPYTNLLLSVTVCHASASHLLAQHVPESPPVEISRSNEYDRYLQYVTASGATNPVAQPMALYTTNTTH